MSGTQHDGVVQGIETKYDIGEKLKKEIAKRFNRSLTLKSSRRQWSKHTLSTAKKTTLGTRLLW